MARKRATISTEDLIEITKHGAKRFIRYDEGRMLYSMGRNRFIELARKADARYMVNGVILCDMEKINEYITENCKIVEDDNLSFDPSVFK